MGPGAVPLTFPDMRGPLVGHPPDLVWPPDPVRLELRVAVRVCDASVCGVRLVGARGNAQGAWPRHVCDVAAESHGHRAWQGRGGVVARHGVGHGSV
jgi:hypothetical protein